MKRFQKMLDVDITGPFLLAQAVIPDMLEAGRGHIAKSQTLRQQAREIITYIADHCPPDLRASFLYLPEVQAVLDSIPDQ
jgi:hypothetical protein